MESIRFINDKINVVAEKSVVDLISALFDAVAYVDPETLKYNIGLASDGGMSKSDRSIRLELANYILNRFAYIYVGLIVDYKFRDAFIEAIQMEILLDTGNDVDSMMLSDIRKQMETDNPSRKPSKGNYIVDLSVYNSAALDRISDKITSSFSAFDNYKDGIDLLAARLTQRDRTEIGFCISNFMYAIRALSKNGQFADYVKYMIKQVGSSISE